MPFDGNGNFNLVYNWENDAANAIPITASRMDGQETDMAQNGFDLCLTRDGQSTITANIPFSGFKLTGLGAPTTAGDSLSYPLSTAIINGTTTNDDATPGDIGEYISATGTNVAMTSGSYVNVASISLTAGDWDVSGNICDRSSGASTVQFIAGIVTTSAGTPTPPNAGAYLQVVTTSESDAYTVGNIRQSLAATTTIYLVCRYDTTGGNGVVTGFLAARRAR